MGTDAGEVDSRTESTLYGKVVGLVSERSHVRALCEAFAELGVQEVEILDGAEGVTRLESWRDVVSHYFFGDMELEMVQRYLDAVRSGLIVFVAAVVPETADQAAETAKQQGASEIVHFGNSVITNY